MYNLTTVLKIGLLAALIAWQFIGTDFRQQISSTYPVIDLIINYLTFLLVANLSVGLLSYYYRKRKKYEATKKDNVLSGLENLYYLIIAPATIMAILGFWGIDARTLFTSLSIVAAAIAILSKDYLSEIISGIIISFSNELSIGDYVKIGDHKGKILEITLTKIALSNEDDDVVFIPNNKVFSSEVVNYTKRTIRKVNIDFELDIRYLKTVEELEQDLILCLEDYHDHIEKNHFNLRVVRINKESLFLKFQFQLYHMDRDLERELRKKTVRRVINYIKSAKLPQNESTN